MEDIATEMPAALSGTADGGIVRGRGTGTQELRALAVDVIDEYLGSVVSAVAQTLMRYGELDLSKLMAHARRMGSAGVDMARAYGRGPLVFDKLTPEMVKSALVVLIRHNIVQMDTREVSDAPRQSAKPPQKAIYSLCPRRALMLLRHGQITANVYKNCGPAHACIVEELLILGAESRENIINNVAVRVAGPKDAHVIGAFSKALEGHPLLDGTTSWTEPLSPSEEGAPMRDILSRPEAIAAKQVSEELFDELVAQRVIIPQKKFTVKTVAQEQELKVAAQAAAANKGRKRAAAASRKSEGPAKRPAKAPNAPAVKETAGCVELRKLLPRPVQPALASEQDSAEARAPPHERSNKQAGAADTGGAGKEAEEGDEDARLFPPGDPRGATWYRVNWNYFLQYFRAELICEHLRDRGQDPLFEKILWAIFEANIRQDVHSYGGMDQDPFDLPPDSRRAVNETVLLDTLRQQVGSTLGDMRDAGHVLGQYLHALQAISDGVVILDGEPGRRDVSVDFGRAVRLLKKRCMLKQVKSEHGMEGLRIVNLLLEKHVLEEKEVGDLAMLAPQTARSKLCALLKDGYLFLEETSKRGDLNPSYTYFLFRAEQRAMEQVVGANALKGMLNMRIRLRLENIASKKYDEVDFQVERERGGEITREELRRVQGIRQFTKIRFNVDNLERAVMNLDKTCLLLTTLLDTSSQ